MKEENSSSFSCMEYDSVCSYSYTLARRTVLAQLHKNSYSPTAARAEIPRKYCKLENIETVRVLVGPETKNLCLRTPRSIHKTWSRKYSDKPTARSSIFECRSVDVIKKKFPSRAHNIIIRPCSATTGLIQHIDFLLRSI